MSLVAHAWKSRLKKREKKAALGRRMCFWLPTSSRKTLSAWSFPIILEFKPEMSSIIFDWRLAVVFRVG